MTIPTNGAEMPEAMRLADALGRAKDIDYYNHVQADLQAAAAELRRLYALSAADPAAPADPSPELKRMTAHRATFFLERFLREEKLLGPNEQAAVRFAVAALAAPQAQQSGAADGWLITYTNGAGEKRRVVSGHNCVADYRDQFPDAKSFPLTAEGRTGAQAVPSMSSAEINALPAAARDFICQLETICDPAGIVRENMQLRDTNAGLQVMYRKAFDAAVEAAACAAEAYIGRPCAGEVLASTIRALSPAAAPAAVSAPKGHELGEDGWPKLAQPAKTAGGTFGKGVSTRLLVESCYRRAQYEAERAAQTSDERREEERNRRALWDIVNGPLSDVTHAAVSAPIGFVSALGLRLFQGSASDHTIALRHTQQPDHVPLYAQASAQAAPSDVEALRHSANEWADMATNGLQWLRNIVDGISDPKDALANMEINLAHCRAVNDAPEVQRSKPRAPAVKEPTNDR